MNDEEDHPEIEIMSASEFFETDHWKKISKRIIKNNEYSLGCCKLIINKYGLKFTPAELLSHTDKENKHEENNRPKLKGMARR